MYPFGYEKKIQKWSLNQENKCVSFEDEIDYREIKK